jgi:hypothetical protein
MSDYRPSRRLLVITAMILPFAILNLYVVLYFTLSDVVVVDPGQGRIRVFHSRGLMNIYRPLHYIEAHLREPEFDIGWIDDRVNAISFD